ncbi:MAG: hypothetical protein K2O40_14555, partial [Lachnospiraceae bacterium]|nr:hypothetical protein [Lachnospiraceae bacterium]
MEENNRENDDRENINREDINRENDNTENDNTENAITEQTGSGGMLYSTEPQPQEEIYETSAVYGTK